MPDTPIFFLVNKCDIDEEAAVLDADSDSEEHKPRLSESASHSSNRVSFDIRGGMLPITANRVRFEKMGRVGLKEFLFWIGEEI